MPLSSSSRTIKKAFGSAKRAKIWSVLKGMGMCETMIKRTLNDN